MSAFSLIVILLAALATVGLGAALLQLLHLKNLPPSLTVGVGYGLGVVAIGKALLWASYANLPLGVSSWVMVAIGITAGIWVLYCQFLPLNLTSIGSAQQSASLRPIPTRPSHRDPIIVGLALLMVAHLCITLGNNLTRPIFPWDAFTTWMYRAKAWALQDAIAPMGTVPEWIAEGGKFGYALYASHYPTALSIYAAFASSLAGGWHSAAASTPWTLCLLALCLTTHGALVLTGFSQRMATIGAFLLCSLPLLNVHATLAGYGDLWMALFSGGGLALLLLWRIKLAQDAFWIGLLLLLAGTQIKTEGWLWLMLGLAFLSLEWLARQVGYRWLFVGIAFLGLAAWTTGVTSISLGPLGLWGFDETHLHAGTLGGFALRPYDPTSNYFTILFEQANFLLLACAFLFALLVALIFSPTQAGPIWLMALLIALSQAIIFAMTFYSQYAETGTAITRLLIHFTPVATVTVSIAWQFAATALQSGKFASSSTGRAPQNALVTRLPWTPLAPALILALALLSPTAILLTPPKSQIERQSLAFDAIDFVAIVGRTTQTDQGLKFVDSPINIGVLSAPLEQASQLLPRYLITDVSIEKPGDAAFYWIVKGEVDVQSISISASEKIIEDMHRYPKWQGKKIKEIGYLVSEDALPTTLLSGLSIQNSLGFYDTTTLAHQWLMSEPSSQRLINNTTGHLETPINRNAWLSISFIALLILVCGGTLLSSKAWALQSGTGAIMALWIVSDFVATTASEGAAKLINPEKQQVTSHSEAEQILTNAVSKLEGLEVAESPILIVDIDRDSPFLAQRLPFDLLPRPATHTNLHAIRGLSGSWNGPVILLGEDNGRLLDAAAEMVAGDTGKQIQQYDGFAIVHAP